MDLIWVNKDFLQIFQGSRIGKMEENLTSERIPMEVVHRLNHLETQTFGHIIVQ